MLELIDRRALLLGSLACLTVSPAQAAASVDRLILSETNALRRRANLPPLRNSSALQKAAANQARVMARTGNFSHKAGGTSITQRARTVGYRYSYLAENIAFRSHRASGEALAKAFIEQWMNSSGHRRNILSRKAREVGIGVAMAGNKVYAVQFFGTRR